MWSMIVIALSSLPFVWLFWQEEHECSSKCVPQAQQQPIIIRPNSFTVLDLHISNLLSGASWNAKLLLSNQHHALEIFVERFEIFCYNHQGNILCQSGTNTPWTKKTKFGFDLRLPSVTRETQ